MSVTLQLNIGHRTEYMSLDPEIIKERKAKACMIRSMSVDTFTIGSLKAKHSLFNRNIHMEYTNQYQDMSEASLTDLLHTVREIAVHHSYSCDTFSWTTSKNIKQHDSQDMNGCKNRFLDHNGSNVVAPVASCVIKDNSVILPEDNIELMNQTHSKNKNIKKKKRCKNKRWKTIPLDNHGFTFSLFPWHGSNAVVTMDMENEFCEFEKLCMDDVSNEVTLASTNNETSEKEITKAGHLKKITDRLLDEDDAFYFKIGQTLEVTFAELLSTPQYYIVENLSGNMATAMKRTRSKRKWQIKKVREHLSEENCVAVMEEPDVDVVFNVNKTNKKWTSVFKTIYTRKIKRRYPPVRHYRKYDSSSAFVLSSRNADRSLDSSTVTKLIELQGRNITRQDKNLLLRLDKHIHIHNADSEMDIAIIHLLMQMQTRDITPEDYDLLLRLDERVRAKAVEARIIGALKTEDVRWQLVGETCAICMEEYTCEDRIKYLPCGHFYHDDCVLHWLQSSTKCPLDGIEMDS